MKYLGGGVNYNRSKTSKTWPDQAKALGSRCLPVFRFLPQVIHIYFVTGQRRRAAKKFVGARVTT